MHQGSTCNLQKYAYDFEIKESSFSRKKFGYPTDESNPFNQEGSGILCSLQQVHQDMQGAGHECA